MMIRISRDAEEDLAKGYRFYEAQQAGLGGCFRDALIADIDSLAQCGYRHEPGLCECQRLLARRFPFAIYYLCSGDSVVVTAVLACRPRPLG